MKFSLGYKIKKITFFFLILCFNSLNAQDVINSKKNKILNNRIRNITFLQQTLNYSSLSYFSPPYFDIGSPKNGYILSADIIPQFIIGGKWMKFPIHITPRYKVRIFKDNSDIGDNSLPVRTPSFMPGATVYIPLNFMDESTLKIEYLSFSVFHHSNGQDGDEYNSDSSINLYNGNFSTNYFEPAYHFRSRVNDMYLNTKSCSDAQPNYFDFYGRIGLEKHFLTARNIKNSYGDYRVNLTIGLIRVKNYCDHVLSKQIEESYYREKHRIVFNSTIILGNRVSKLGNFKKRINLSLDYNWRIPSSPNTSLFFGAGYYGSDTYNIYFEQSYAYIHAGLSLGFFVAPKMLGLKK